MDPHHRLPSTVLHIMGASGGGAAISTIGLMHGLRERGIDSVAVCQSGGKKEDDDMLRDATSGRVLFTHVYWWNKKIRAATWKRPPIAALQNVRTFFGWKAPIEIAERSRAWNVDLLHTNSMTICDGARASILAKLPHVWHVRELTGTGQPFQYWRNGRIFGSFLQRHAEILVANSEASAACLEGIVPRSFVKTAPNGIDLSAFLELEPHPDRKPLVVGMIGAVISRSKEHRLFIEAAARVQTKRECTFRIYGTLPREDDPYFTELKQAVAALGLSDRFTFAGHVDTRTILEEIDVLVNPSAVESFGRVVVEAMSAALPVVGANGGGVGEIVKHGATGLLVERGDAAGMARAISSLVEDTELRLRLGHAGRERAKKHYSLEGYVDGVIGAYARAMLAHRARSPVEVARDLLL